MSKPDFFFAIVKQTPVYVSSVTSVILYVHIHTPSFAVSNYCTLLSDGPVLNGYGSTVEGCHNIFMIIGNDGQQNNYSFSVHQCGYYDKLRFREIVDARAQLKRINA